MKRLTETELKTDLENFSKIVREIYSLDLQGKYDDALEHSKMADRYYALAKKKGYDTKLLYKIEVDIRHSMGIND